MSAVDLAGDDEFLYSGEEAAYALEADSESGDQGDSSSSDEDAARRCTQPDDYTPLELAQRRRSRPRVRSQGGSAVPSSSPGGFQSLSEGVAASSGGVRLTTTRSQVPVGSLSPARRRLRTRILQGAGTSQQWQRGGSVATVAGINLFTNRAPGSVTLRPLPEPIGTPHSSE